MICRDKPIKKPGSPAEFEQLRDSILKSKDPSRICITVCCGTGCCSSRAREVFSAFEKEIKKHGLDKKVDTKATGCHGFCERGPLVVIFPKRIFYQRVSMDDVAEIVAETIINNKVINRLLYVDPSSQKEIVCENEVPFYKKQQRIIFGNNGMIDPNNIDDYIALGGYAGLSRALFGPSPEQVITTIKQSGLRGRGGAGFSTGKKWEICRSTKDQPKYIVCNGDEGDPGAFMDRSLLEGNPHSVLEGMIIGAYAIGANEGYLYVRTEYPLALRNVEIAITQAEECGLLGKNILGFDFSFRIKVIQGAGAFVSGEETALLASIEGRVGRPHPRPPYPAKKGLWDKPTNINNVKTWASVPYIIIQGADWHSKIGTKNSKGTMIFSLVGKINNTGLVEVPMGITLREIIYGIGGGIPGGKKFKAVQTGGPSGGCIPTDLLDLPVDYEELTKAGSMMGSGGMIVMDEDTCMVDIARYFTNFLQQESCGKCSICREGTQRMYEILTGITEGHGKEEDLVLLEELGKIIKDASMCGLGQTAPNPLLSTLRYFKDEYIAHIKEKKCDAGVCKSLLTYVIDTEKCTGCGLCQKNCPQQVIEGEPKKSHSILQDKCIKCGICYDVCKFDAVVKATGDERCLK